MAPQRADAPQCSHFSTVNTPSWITEQISVGQCVHRGTPARWKRQTIFKMVTWTKQTWMKQNCRVHCCYVHVCFVQVTMCGAPDAPRCSHFSTVISPSWITEQISVGKCAHQGASARREHQTSFKIVPWTKQPWTKHHNTARFLQNREFGKQHT